MKKFDKIITTNYKLPRKTMLTSWANDNNLFLEINEILWKPYKNN